MILDDSGHRKHGNFTSGLGRQYIGEIGKTDNGIVTVTTHYYDGKKSLPLDIELYQHSSFLQEGKDDKLFQKKPDLGIQLIDRSLDRGYRPGIVLIDAGYGNNTAFLKKLEDRRLKYAGGVAKNRKVIITPNSENEQSISLYELLKSLPSQRFEEVLLLLEKPRKVWVATFKALVSRLEGERTFAIVMNASSYEEATDIDDFITNVDPYKVTSEWIVKTYQERNWVEVFYREALIMVRVKRISSER